MWNITAVYSGLTVEADGTFDLTHNGADGSAWRGTGAGVIDIESGFVNLTDFEETVWDVQGQVEFGPSLWNGDGIARVAFVPFDRGVAVSGPWNEEVDPMHPYGYYRLLFERPRRQMALG